MKTPVHRPSSSSDPSGAEPDRHLLNADILPRIRRDQSEDGIVTLIFDHPDRSANLFDRETLAELDQHLLDLETEPGVSGLILATAKPGIFVAGADLKAFSEATAEDVDYLLRLGQDLFQRLADLPFPTVASIHGACLGGGLELALGCDWRVASTDHVTSLGLPETQLGILPAWGGTTRLPRLIGLSRALPLILGGKPVSASRARKLGLVDATAFPEQLPQLAVSHVKKGKRPRASRFAMLHALPDLITGAVARRGVRAKTRGLYPAPLRALEVAVDGLRGGVATSLEAERKAFRELFESPESRNLMRTFFLQERSKRGALGWTGPHEDREVTTCGVIGAGVMGAGIAHWLSTRGQRVLLFDIDPAKVADGLSRIDKLFAEGVKRHVMTEQEARQARDRIVPLAEATPLRGVKLIVEAATEDLEVKKAIFRDLVKRADPDAILATNTSALPIAKLADAIGEKDAARLVGLHFFNPVHRMKLVEVVRGAATSEEKIYQTVQFVRRISKLPVVVKDSPGFLVNRILMPYLIETGRIVEEGIDPREIDAALLDFGMPMGPVRLLDEIGLDVARHVGRTMEEGFGARMAVPEILRALVEAGHLGKKSGSGFYLHRGKGAPAVNPACRQFERREAPRREIAERLVLLMVNEAWRCLEEGVATDPRDIDLAMIFGTGFAPFRGGPIQYAETRGLRDIAETLRGFTDVHGTRYRPCETLARTLPGCGASPEPLAEISSVTPMKTTPTADREPRSVIDTSKMSPEERAALELTEAARTQAGSRNSLAGSFFMGTPDFDLVKRFPAQSLEDRDQGDAFLHRFESFLRQRVDPDAIDRDGEIPREVMEGLAELGAFGIKIPTRYGGLGLSQTNYSRTAMLMGGVCGNLTALLSAHQSIGVPQPLLMFGSDAQKERYLPRLARGEVSAFGLTEADVGSDPAKMTTIARPVDGGEFYEISGEKLWCTNGTVAGLLVVMAKVVDDVAAARHPGSARTITAFIVEANAPGVTVVQRCHFMGLRALYNGVIRFENVRVSRDAIILAPGRGLKVALSTLNTGRLTLPAACVGMAKQCLDYASCWSRDRVQWGAPIYKHDAIAQKLARMAAETFAMEAMVLYTSALVDRDKNADIRIEAAFAKMWGTERGWEIADQTMQIRGGRGYETAQSLERRGEEPVPVERMLRDCRINTIFEGSSEIMRLFIAREALDPHLNMGGPVLNSMLPPALRVRALLRSALFYSLWYPKLWLPRFGAGLPGHWDGQLRRDLGAVRGLSRKLGRRLFHAMLRHGPKLEKKQVLLGRFVEAGAELFAMTTALSYAQHLLETGERSREEVLGLVTYFCEISRIKAERCLEETSRFRQAEAKGYQLARRVVEREGENRA